MLALGKRCTVLTVGMATCVLFGAATVLAQGLDMAPSNALAMVGAATGLETLPQRLSTLLGGSTPTSKAQVDVDELAALKVFYAAREFRPLWVVETGLNPRAVQVLAALERADDFGLNASDFAVPKLNTISLETLAASDVAITRAVLKYARFARGGRIADPSLQLSEYIDRKPQLIAPAIVLDQISTGAAPDDVLRGFHPKHAQFERLRQAYLTARAAKAQSSTVRLPDGPLIFPGQTDPAVALLRRRLGLPNTSAPELYDPPLVAAVIAFQTKAGLRRPDGIIGDKTRVSLNAGGVSQIPTLLANMEQWRWMPTSLGETNVQVNVPEYTVRVVTGDRVVLTERVVTGKLETATPLFSAPMQTVVFQPKWGVPDSIKVNELLPRLKEGRGLRPGLKMSLNGRDIDPWRINWERADSTRYHIYQPSGDDNALGVVKFLFPNKHAVYLHDTPSKNLFNTTQRAYSHGCVRVRNPVRLAELLLGSDKGWNTARVRNLVEDGPEDNAIKLDAQIPVHITYFTATVDDAGHVQTFADVYGHERRITQALDGRGDRIVKLSPQPTVTVRRAIARSGDDDLLPLRRRVAVEAARFEPPAALGLPQVQRPPPARKFVDAPSSGGSDRGRYRGNSTNDIIMRSIGNGF